MQIIIAGAGAVGRSIAKEMLLHGHTVTLLDNKPSKMQVASVADAEWILADTCSPMALADAGLADADILVSATGEDKVNLVASLLAKTEFGVPKTVARVNNPKNAWMFNESWGVDVAVSTPEVMTSLILEVVSEGVPVPLFTFPSSGCRLISITIPADSILVGQELSLLKIPPSVIVSGVLRDTHPLNPTADLVLQEKDELLFLLPEESLSEINSITEYFTAINDTDGDIIQED